VVIGSRGATLSGLERGALVVVGKERNEMGLPALAAVRVRAAAGLTNVSKTCPERVSLSGEIEWEMERDVVPGPLESATVSLLSQRRDLAAEAFVGCSSLDLEDSVREEGRGNDPPRAR
jgi:hypothetical protein